MDPDEDGPVLLHLLEIKDVAGSPALSNPEAVKGKAFETLRQLAVKGSQRRPLILVLEDLHWVDKISEEFLGFLAENVRDARVLLLATYRPGYRPPWIDKSYAGQTAAATVVPGRQHPNGSLGASGGASDRSGYPGNRRQGRRQSVLSSSNWHCMPARQGTFART